MDIRKRAWYNVRRLLSLRPQNCVAILAEVAKDYSISGYDIVIYESYESFES